MEDVKQLALELLEVEKRYLLEDKEEYSVAVVVVVTQEGHEWEEVIFDDEVQKFEAYAGVVTRAKETNAEAIITINTSRQQTPADGENLDCYWWGRLESEDCPRALTLTISGPGMNALCLSQPYRFKGGAVELGQLSEFQPARIGLLPNWP